MIAPDAEAVAGDLHVDVAIADVPSEPRQFVGACGGDFDERFGPSDDAHNGAILQYKSVAVMQGNRLWEVEQKRCPALAGQNNPAAMPVMGVEHDRIDGAGVIPMAGRPDFTSTLHSHSMMLSSAISMRSDSGTAARVRRRALARRRIAYHHVAMINKIVQTMAEAMAGIRDGAIVLIGGFGAVGQPNALIDGLIEQGATELTVVANNAGVGHVGLARLMELGRVRKIVCSFPRTSDPVVFETLYGRQDRAGDRAARHARRAHPRRRRRHAGVLHATAVGTKLGEGKEDPRDQRPPMCWRKRCTATWRWSRPGRPTAGAT